VPDKETLESITVIRLTHDGIPVKSTDVPDAVTAVSLTIAPLLPETPSVPLRIKGI
jgi:hypothetical protein